MSVDVTNLTQTRAATDAEMRAYHEQVRAVVAELPRHGIQSDTYFFDTEDEAHAFKANVKDDLAEQEHFDFVDADVEYVAGTGSWRLRVDYIDRRPTGPEPLAA